MIGKNHERFFDVMGGLLVSGAVRVCAGVVMWAYFFVLATIIDFFVIRFFGNGI